MGTLHLQGAYGVEQNYELAREYFALAAQQGDLGGLTNMGFLYAKVPHLPPSHLLHAPQKKKVGMKDRKKRS